jgi:hypothetical protein
VGLGECALAALDLGGDVGFDAEELGLFEGGGDGACGDDDQGSGGSGGVLVEGASEAALSDAGLAEEEDRAALGAWAVELSELGEDVERGGAGADESEGVSLGAGGLGAEEQQQSLVEAEQAAWGERDGLAADEGAALRLV